MIALRTNCAGDGQGAGRLEDPSLYQQLEEPERFKNSHTAHALTPQAMSSRWTSVLLRTAVDCRMCRSTTRKSCLQPSAPALPKFCSVVIVLVVVVVLVLAEDVVCHCCWCWLLLLWIGVFMFLNYEIFNSLPSEHCVLNWPASPSSVKLFILPSENRVKLLRFGLYFLFISCTPLPPPLPLSPLVMMTSSLRGCTTYYIK